MTVRILSDGFSKSKLINADVCIFASVGANTSNCQFVMSDGPTAISNRLPGTYNEW